MHFMRPPLRQVGVLVLSAVMLASAVVGSEAQTQGPPTEAELKAQIAEQPALPAPYLALATIYVEQGRLAEAEKMISNALALTRRQLASSPAEPQGPPARSDLGAEHPDALRVGGDLPEPRKLTDVKPEYPADALAAGVSGIVILELLLDEQGRVADAAVVRSVPMLNEAAETAVRQWEFTPTYLNGQPKEVIMTVTVSFRIGD